MKKILLVSGCSFTAAEYQSISYPSLDTSWPKWPEILAEKLGMEVVNLAISGAGNKYIYSSLLDYIKAHDTNNIGMVIAAWSQSQRLDYEDHPNIRGLDWLRKREKPYGNIMGWVRESLRYYMSFEMLCSYHKLPYKHCQMIALFEHYFEPNKNENWVALGSSLSVNDKIKNLEELKDESNQKWFDLPPEMVSTKNIKDNIDQEEIIIEFIRKNLKVKKNNFIGYPIVPSLGGYTVAEFLKIYKNPDLRISPRDAHPTGKGHAVIAEHIYENL